MTPIAMAMVAIPPACSSRSLIIGLTAFLTVVDLFATQAILPSLARHYGVSAGAMGFAVNASTMGMAIAGLGMAFFSRRIDRRLGILMALSLLAIPTDAARHRAESGRLHGASHRPGPLHGLRFYADARVSCGEHRPGETAAPLPPTSPAMSPATWLAG